MMRKQEPERERERDGCGCGHPKKKKLESLNLGKHDRPPNPSQEVNECNTTWGP